jgi:hypothetical protein
VHLVEGPNPWPVFEQSKYGPYCAWCLSPRATHHPATGACAPREVEIAELIRSRGTVLGAYLRDKAR